MTDLSAKGVEAARKAFQLEMFDNARSIFNRRELDETLEAAIRAYLGATPPEAVNDELVNAFRELRLTAAMLQQNAEGCAVNHYGDDFRLSGLPGWLTDSRKVIDRSIGLLARLATKGGE